VGLEEKEWESVNSQKCSIIYLSIDFGYIWLAYHCLSEQEVAPLFVGYLLCTDLREVVLKTNKVTASPGVSHMFGAHIRHQKLERALPSAGPARDE
jgi:hypothetical protein